MTCRRTTNTAAHVLEMLLIFGGNTATCKIIWTISAEMYDELFTHDV